MPEMSPEVDLLERLRAEDANLEEAAFGSCFAFRDIAHARSVVNLYLMNKWVELYDSHAEAKAMIVPHQARAILVDDAQWSKGTRYFLRITEEGEKKFIDDSEGFFKELFPG